MFLSLKVLNSDATLNNFQDIGTLQTAKGADAKVVLQLFQPDKKIRYVPTAGAVITIDFKKADNTVLTKTATHPFADDRSIIQVVLSDVETADLISQALVAKIVEGTDISFAILQSGFQMVSLTSGC
jgi:hypothetical protein